MKDFTSLLDGVTDADIAKHTPSPAPLYRGAVMVLMALSPELVRYYVATQMARARITVCALQNVQLICRAAYPVILSLFEKLNADTFPTDSTPDSVRHFFTVAGKEMEVATAAVIEMKPDPMDELIVSRFPDDLMTALTAHHLQVNPDADWAHLKHGVYMHEGVWVVAVENCNCSQCQFFERLTESVEPSDQVPQEIIDQLLSEHEGSVLVTDPDTLDLTDYDEHDRYGIRAHLRAEISSGAAVIDLGFGKDRRFMMRAVRAPKMPVDVAELMVFFGSVSEPRDLPRQKRGLFQRLFGRQPVPEATAAVD